MFLCFTVQVEEGKFMVRLKSLRNFPFFRKGSLRNSRHDGSIVALKSIMLCLQSSWHFRLMITVFSHVTSMGYEHIALLVLLHSRLCHVPHEGLGPRLLLVICEVRNGCS